MNETTDALVDLRVQSTLRSMAAQRIKAFQDDPAGVFGEEAREGVISDLSNGQSEEQAQVIRAQVLSGAYGDLVARKNMDLQRQYSGDSTFVPRVFSRSERMNIGLMLQGGEDKLPLDPRKASENIESLLSRFGNDGELRQQALRELRVPPVFAGLSGALHGGYNDFLGTFLAVRAGNDATRLIQDRFHLDKKDEADEMINSKAMELEKNPVIGKMLEMSGQGDVHAAGVARDLAAAMLLLPKDRRKEIVDAVASQYVTYSRSPEIFGSSKVDVVLKNGSQVTEDLLDSLHPWDGWRRFVANASGFPDSSGAYQAFVKGVSASESGISPADAPWLAKIGISLVHKSKDGTFTVMMDGAPVKGLSDKALQQTLEERAGMELGRSIANTRLVSDGDMFALQRTDGDRSYIATFTDDDLARRLHQPTVAQATPVSAAKRLASDFAVAMKQFGENNVEVSGALADPEFWKGLPDKIQREMPWITAAYGQLQESAAYLQEMQRWLYETFAEKPFDALTRAMTKRPEE